MSVRYVSGNIVDDDADILVNTVNTVGVMGKGVALAFKTRWPEIMRGYMEICQNGMLEKSRCALLRLPDGRRWCALATKDDWRNPSKLSWVVTGLESLRYLAEKAAGVRSIAIPPPGCGNGGLDWAIVHPIVVQKLKKFDLRIYAQLPTRTENSTIV